MTTITLTSSDTGKSIEARPGDEIVLHLPENPTTGFRWQIESMEDPLELVSDGYVQAEPAPTGAPPVFGRGGIREFVFRVVRPAKARLELKNWQPWEGESSVAERFAVNITVGE